MMEKAKRNREKVEKQREKLRKRELEQQQKEARNENMTEWSKLWISSNFTVAPFQVESQSL